jgi:hypothetical protein
MRERDMLPSRRFAQLVVGGADPLETSVAVVRTHVAAVRAP